MMSGNINKNKALVATDLNYAFFMQEEKAQMICGNNDSSVEQFDNYVYSQLRALNPEIKEETFEDIQELKSKIKREFRKSEALSVALEIMDSNLSEKYRQKAAIYLLEEIQLTPDLLVFISNRFYSTILPKTFNPNLALDVLDTSFLPSLRELYDGLSEKSKLFSQFYTLFKIHLNNDSNNQLLLDYDLTELGIYSQFTRALANRDLVVYNIAASSAIEYFSDKQIEISPNFFDIIKQELSDSYSLKLELPQVDKTRLTEIKHLDVKPRNLRILIWEDDEVITSRIKHALEVNLNVEIINNMHRLAKVSGLGDFASIMRDKDADLVLFDLNTEMKGHELLRILASGFANSNKYIFYSPMYTFETSVIYSMPINALNYFPRRSLFESFVENIAKNFPFALKERKAV